MSLGSHLRELRQRRGLSLDEMARSTRVALRYLEALEGDDLDGLPPAVFTRGFIRAYCQVLREPADAALALYRAPGAPVPTGEAPVLSAAASGPPAGRPDRATESLEAQRRGRGPVLVSFVLLVVLGAALFAVTLALQSARDPAASGNPPIPAAADLALAEAPVAAEPPPPPVPDAPAPPPPAVSVSGLPRERPAPPATDPPALPATPALPSRATPAAPAAPPAALNAPPVVGAVTAAHRLVARTTQLTWIRVRTEDGRTTEETLPAGEIREWVSNRFVLTVGNAGGIYLELDGRQLPPLGASGEVIERLVLPPEAR